VFVKEINKMGDEKEEENRQEEKAAEPETVKQTYVLIVDDDETIRDTLYDLFSDRYQCHVAGTAEQAIAYLDTIPFDVVLTDIAMPGLSGLELLGIVRQRWPDTPVIIISVIDYQQHAGDLIKMGAFDHFVKPFRLEDVEESVARAIEHHRRLLEERLARH
jgi:DNA-binding NtrC family response regulator